MPPAGLVPGASALNWRPTKSGIDSPPEPAWVVRGRHARGWQGTRSSSCVRSRTSSGPQLVSFRGNHLVLVVRAHAQFESGKLVERTDDPGVDQRAP